MAKPASALSVTPPAEPSDRTKAAIAYAKERLAARRKRVALRVERSAGKPISVGAPHSDISGHHAQLLNAFGTTSSDFVDLALSQLLAAIRSRGEALPSDTAINGALAMIEGLEPETEAEAMLACQMAATHGLAMNLISRTAQAEMLNQMEANGGLAVKLMRTFTMQAEALAKLRRGGGQTVRVEHVHVHGGGQAIVGNVASGGGAPSEQEEQPYAKQVTAIDHADASVIPLRGADSERERLPVSSHGERALPIARRRVSGGTKGQPERP